MQKKWKEDFLKAFDVVRLLFVGWKKEILKRETKLHDRNISYYQHEITVDL
jgi:hypothetical protein